MEETKKIIKINGEEISIADLAIQSEVKTTEIIKFFFMKGEALTINSYLDLGRVEDFCAANELEMDMVDEKAEMSSEMSSLNENTGVTRPPVVTIMGHVDHGKTSLLDFIRKAKVADGEAGGITQSIGAYQAQVNDKKITFIDTPGHELFTEMRARGSNITDIVIVVVAADDSVMPQTIEAIDHAKASQKPIIVAINKIDKPQADAEKVLMDVSQHGLMPEEWGGTVPFIPVSAHTGEGIDKLLETILLIAEVEELKAPETGVATGVIIEAHTETGKGSVGTILIQTGELKIGDAFASGSISGKIRTMENSLGEKLKVATPATPVKITGLGATPEPGQLFRTFDSEKDARQHAQDNKHSAKGAEIRKKLNETKDSGTDQKVFNIILRADLMGSVEAIKTRLLTLENDDAIVKVLAASIGEISNTDLALAEASDAIIYTFNIRPSAAIRKAANNQNIKIKTFDIVYKLFEDIGDILTGALNPVFEEEITGEAEIRAIFSFSKIGKIAGAMVTSGKISRTDKLRVLREGKLIAESVFGTLKKEKQDVGSVSEGAECGFTIKNYQDIKEGDVVQTYKINQV